MGDTLVVFAKAPIMGRAKTRLARDLGSAFALGLYRRWTARLLREVRDPRWRVVLSVSPDVTVTARFSSWAPAQRAGMRGRHKQGAGNLGERMARAVTMLAPGPVVIVGSDIPDLRRTDIAAAFAALKAHDIVLGPAPDGGYWLIGLKSPRLAARLRGPIRWSSPHARADTLAALGSPCVAFLRVLGDIDTGADYAAWISAGAPRGAE